MNINPFTDGPMEFPDVIAKREIPKPCPPAKPLRFHYVFHSVGQGLFASGLISDLVSESSFAWVFDCGSVSKRPFLQREIAEFKQGFHGDRIGLFCLSHFDEDHINGARELLSQLRVDMLVMPYFPLVERMQIALGTPGISDDYLRFLAAPAEYMFSAAGDNLNQVVFVAGGGELGQAGQADVLENTPSNPDTPWAANPPDTSPPELPANEDTHGVSDQKSMGPVRVVGHQKPFSVEGMWEFLFFNEHVPVTIASALGALRQEVAAILRKYRRRDGSFDGTGLLRELKILYSAKFGATGLARNKISLVAYSGPIHDHRQIHSSDFWNFVVPIGSEMPPGFDCDCWRQTKPDQPGVSIGYFGDYPLTTADRVHNVRNHIRSARWNRLHVVQIPHHGSSHSWYPGASGEFTHRASVISSALHSKHHPSQSVLDDLSTHGILLVNEMQRVVFCGHVIAL